MTIATWVNSRFRELHFSVQIIKAFVSVFFSRWHASLPVEKSWIVLIWFQSDIVARENDSISIVRAALSSSALDFVAHNCHPANVVEHKSTGFSRSKQCCARLSANKPQLARRQCVHELGSMLSWKGASKALIEFNATRQTINFLLALDRHEDLHKWKLINVTICYLLAVVAFFATSLKVKMNIWQLLPAGEAPFFDYKVLSHRPIKLLLITTTKRFV